MTRAIEGRKKRLDFAKDNAAIGIAFNGQTGERVGGYFAEVQRGSQRCLGWGATPEAAVQDSTTVPAQNGFLE
jgi:hypothetical protein